jgi:hypothetical protein
VVDCSEHTRQGDVFTSVVKHNHQFSVPPSSRAPVSPCLEDDQDNDDVDSHESNRDTEDKRFSPLMLSKRKGISSPSVRVRKGSLDNTALARSLAQLDLGGVDEPQPPSPSSSPLSPNTRRKQRFRANLGQFNSLDPKEEEIHAKRQLQRQRRRREVGAATSLSQSAHDERQTAVSETATASLSMSLSEMSTCHANLEDIPQRRVSYQPKSTRSPSPSSRRPATRRSRALSPRPPPSPPLEESSPHQETLRSSSPRNIQTARRARGLTPPLSPTPPEKRSSSPWNRPSRRSSTALSRAPPPEEEERQQQLPSSSQRNRQTRRLSRALSPPPPPPQELEGQPVRSISPRNRTRRRSPRALSTSSPPTEYIKTSHRPIVLNSSNHEGRSPSPRQIPRRRVSSVSKQQPQPERPIQDDRMHMPEGRIDMLGNSSPTAAAAKSPKAQRHRKRASLRAAPVGTEHTPNTTADVSRHHASDSRLNYRGGSDFSSSSHASSPRHLHRTRASMQTSVMDKVGSILNLSSRSRASVSPKRSTSSGRSHRRSSSHASQMSGTSTAQSNSDLENRHGKLSTSNSSLDLSDGSNSNLMSSAVLPWKTINSSLDIAIDPHSTFMSSAVLPWKPMNRRRAKSLVVDYHSSGVSNSAVSTTDSQRGSRTVSPGVGSRASVDLGHSSSSRSSSIMDVNANHSSLSSLDPLEDLQPQVDTALPVGASILVDDDMKNNDVDKSERTLSSRSNSGSRRSSSTHGEHRRRRASVSGGKCSILDAATTHRSLTSFDPSVLLKDVQRQEKKSVSANESNLLSDHDVDQSRSGRSQPSKTKSGNHRSSSTPREHRRRRHSITYVQAPDDSVNIRSNISLDPVSLEDLHHPMPKADANKRLYSREQQDGAATIHALADTVHWVPSSSERRGEPSSSSSDRQRSRSRRRGSSKGQQHPKDKGMAMNDSSIHSLDPLSLLVGLEDSSRRHDHTVLHASAGTVIERPGQPSTSSHHRRHGQSSNISVVSNDTWLQHSVHTLDTMHSLPFEVSDIHNHHGPSKQLRRASVDGATVMTLRGSPPTPQGQRHQRRNSAYASMQARFDGGGRAGTESYSATAEASVDSPHTPKAINVTHFLGSATSLRQWLNSGKSPSPRQAIKVTKHQPQQSQETGGGSAGSLHASSSALPIDPLLLLLSPSSPVSFNKSVKTNITQSTSSTLPLCDDEVDGKDEEGVCGKENTTENAKKEGTAPLVSRNEGNKNKKSGNDVAPPTNSLVSQWRPQETNVEFEPVSWESDIAVEPEPEVAEGRKPRESRLRAKFRKISAYF